MTQFTIRERPSQATAIVTGILVLVICSIGLVSGIIALTGLPRHGRKGILWPALTGISIWVLLFVMAVPTFLRARERALQAKARSAAAAKRPAAIHIAGADQVQDSEVGFSFDLPEGYESFPKESMPGGYSHAFLRQTPGEINRLILISRLRGILPPQQHLSAADVPSATAKLTRFNWRGIEVDGFRVPEKVQGMDYLTFNIQIPLRKQAIQIGIGGPMEAEEQLRKVAKQLLESLDGETNW